MGSSKGWCIYNFDQPRRRTIMTEEKLHRLGLTPKRVFHYLLDNFAFANSGKALADRHTRGEQWWHERSRGEEQAYYTVRLDGKWLTVTRTIWTIDGDRGANTFLGGFLMNEDSVATCESEVIVRHPWRDYKGFLEAYRQASPDLGWD